LLVVGNLVLNVPFEKMTAIEIVDGDIEEALILRVVQVHGNDMVRASTSEQVCNQSTGLSDPLLVTTLWLESSSFSSVGAACCASCLHGPSAVDTQCLAEIIRVLCSRLAGLDCRAALQVIALQIFSCSHLL